MGLRQALRGPELATSADDLTMADVHAWIQGMPDSQPVDGGHEPQPGHIAATAGVRREVELLAAAWAITPGEAVGWLVDHYHRSLRPAADRPGSAVDRPANDAERPGGDAERICGDDVPIHGVYAGVRIAAVYHRRTRSVTVTSDPLPGRHFGSPSGASTAAVAALNPSIEPTRTGWNFWIVTATGKRLRTIRFL